MISVPVNEGDPYDGEPYILMKDNSGKTCIALNVGTVDGCHISFNDTNGKSTLDITGNRMGTGISVYDAGKIRASMVSYLEKDAEARVSKVAQDQKIPPSFEPTTSGELRLYAKDGSVVAKLP